MCWRRVGRPTVGVDGLGCEDVWVYDYVVGVCCRCGKVCVCKGYNRGV